MYTMLAESSATVHVLPSHSTASFFMQILAAYYLDGTHYSDSFIYVVMYLNRLTM